MEISFTQFRVYSECPWKYKLLFVDRKRIPQTAPSSLGQSLHKALESYHRSNEGTLEKLLECYERRWVSGGYASDAQADEYFAKGRRMLERYFAADAERRTQIEGIEREFFYPLGRHMVRGMIDRYDLHPDGRHEVIDYKSRLGSDTEAPDSAWLQLRFYALGLRECLGIAPALMTVHYLAESKKESRPCVEAEEEALKASIEKAADAIEDGRFPPDTAFCPRCDFRKICTHSVAKGD